MATSREKLFLILAAVAVFSWGVYVLKHPDWYVARELRGAEKLARFKFLGVPTRFLLKHTNKYEPKALRREALTLACFSILWSILVVCACLFAHAAP